MRLLVIEDEVKVADAIRSGLSDASYDVDVAGCAEVGLEMNRRGTYDLIILDVMLPGMDGFEALRCIRSEGRDVKILLLTAIDRVQDKVSALNYGADDYLTKPFDFNELLARVTAILRRGSILQTDLLRAGLLVLDKKKQLLTRNGIPIDVTPREFALLEYLLLHKNEVVTRTAIAQNVWHYGFAAETNVIDVYINYLRRKIDERAGVSLIQTVRGRGYMLTDS